jgi:Ca2+-binding EF-hand superfamily protein
MISGIGNSGHYAQYAAMMKKIDADDSGDVSRGEFVDAAPDGVTAEAAGNLFDLLDPSKSGSVKDGDLATAFAQFAAATKNILIQQQGDPNGEQPDGQSRGEALFAKLDANGDGTLTRDEFVAARPGAISEEDASKLFDSIAAGGGADADADSLNEDQFAQGVEAQHAKAGGAHRHGGGGGGKKKDDEEEFDALDVNKDGVVSLEEFLAGRPDNVSEDDATSLFHKLTGDETDGSLTKDQFVQGMQDQRAETRQAESQETLKRLLMTLQSQHADSEGRSLDQLMQAIGAYKTAAQQGLASGATSASAAAV